jgi:DNA-binding CsgD family transcriptional regulator
MKMKAASEADRTAIMQVIETESAAYLARDYETWARCWVQAPYVRRWVSTTRRGVNVWDGWEEQGPPMKNFMAAHPVPSTAEYRRETLNLRVGKDMAWATFDQHASGASGPEIDLPEMNYEMRILEKHADGWKIACICSFQRSLDHIASALIRVDQEAAVAWMNSAAEKELRDTRAIVVRAGRLRAVDRTADQRLQAAIRWAGHRDDGVWPRHGTLPIVLDGGHGEPANVCWVIAKSDEVFVAINNQRMVEERLDAAAAVYGITPTQVSLARLIIAGHDLVSAADRLGVRVTTTRTHLQRMFEKTGVRSQPALVRALLSVASPLA